MSRATAHCQPGSRSMRTSRIQVIQRRRQTISPGLRGHATYRPSTTATPVGAASRPMSLLRLCAKPPMSILHPPLSCDDNFAAETEGNRRQHLPVCGCCNPRGIRQRDFGTSKAEHSVLTRRTPGNRVFPYSCIALTLCNQRLSSSRADDAECFRHRIKLCYN
jgi:hypothetical protein